MNIEFIEIPGEQKGSLVGRETSKENKKVNYIEVVPSLPTYYISDCELTRVLKLHIPLQRTTNFGVLGLCSLQILMFVL